MEIPELNQLELIFLASLGVLFLVQIIYYLSVYNRVYRRNRKVEKGKVKFNEELPPLSVIICAKDDLRNLKEFLPSVLEQDYPDFEVIVINDSATDETSDFLKLLKDKYSNLYHSFTPDGSRYISHKKLAVTLGIKASKNDWLVFTDPNCRPASPNWLRLMARNFTPDTEIVLGCNQYEKGKKWLHKKVSFDSLFTCVRTLGLALAGKPYMGCGRNLAYKKELFYKSKGFSDHLNLQRGDDDLFINKVAKKRNTRVETSPDAVVWLKPLEYTKDWREEKISYMATAFYYKGMKRLILGNETFSRLLFYAGLVAAIIYSILFMNWVVGSFAVLLWLIRYIIQAIVINKTAKSLKNPARFYLSLPLFDILQPLQTLNFKTLRNMRGKKDFMRKWETPYS